MSLEPIIEEPEKPLKTATVVSRAERLVRRARWSVGLASVSIVILALLVPMIIDDYFHHFVSAVAGAYPDDAVFVVCLPAMFFAAMSALTGMSAVSRNNTLNRGLALAGMILSSLAFSAGAAASLWHVDESLATGLGVMIGGFLVWLSFDVYFRGRWTERRPARIADEPVDEVMENRLLRLAKWSALVGIAAVIPAAVSFLLDYLNSNGPFYLPDIPHVDWYFVLPAAFFGSPALGLAAAVLSSAATPRRGTVGNSLAWTGFLLGMGALVICSLVLMTTTT